MALPRPEHPRPGFVRDNWINLNGQWSFSFDPGRSGYERKYAFSHGFDSSILVPFCPECSLSGVEYTDFIDIMWYQRKIEIPADWSGLKVYVHFGAVDFEAEVYIDGVPVGRHWGGSSSFRLDITHQVAAGHEHNLVVMVRDELRSGHQMGGKQSIDFYSAGCFYTRVTGIWQTVWLEGVHPLGLSLCDVDALFEDRAFLLRPVYEGIAEDHTLRVRLREGERLLGEKFLPLSTRHVLMHSAELKPWNHERPQLYDLEFSVLDPDGRLLDKVVSYAGLRKVHWAGNQLFLNNEPLYLRQVLDQGYYQDGLWTAPTDAALKHDIELGLAAGFNGARLHQKVFEERYHYWADKLGYLTWAESPCWGLNVKSEYAARNYLTEWAEIIGRDRNRPSIIAWSTFNETWDISDRKAHRRLHLDAYNLTRALDPGRPVNNASGGCHVKTDLYTVHIYEQDPIVLKRSLERGENNEVFRTLGDKEAPYEGQPYLVDEFGGIKWMPDIVRIVKDSWGYGQAPRSLEEFYERLEGQVEALLAHRHICGYCYTQLVDVEQEQNGLFYYDRTPKFDVGRLKEIFVRQGACMSPLIDTEGKDRGESGPA